MFRCLGQTKRATLLKKPLCPILPLSTARILLLATIGYSNNGFKFKVAGWRRLCRYLPQSAIRLWVFCFPHKLYYFCIAADVGPGYLLLERDAG